LIKVIGAIDDYEEQSQVATANQRAINRYQASEKKYWAQRSGGYKGGRGGGVGAGGGYFSVGEMSKRAKALGAAGVDSQTAGQKESQYKNMASHLNEERIKRGKLIMSQRATTKNKLAELDTQIAEQKQRDQKKLAAPSGEVRTLEEERKAMNKRHATEKAKDVEAYKKRYDLFGVSTRTKKERATEKKRMKILQSHLNTGNLKVPSALKNPKQIIASWQLEGDIGQLDKRQETEQREFAESSNKMNAREARRRMERIAKWKEIKEARAIPKGKGGIGKEVGEMEGEKAKIEAEAKAREQRIYEEQAQYQRKMGELRAASAAIRRKNAEETETRQESFRQRHKIEGFGISRTLGQSPGGLSGFKSKFGGKGSRIGFLGGGISEMVAQREQRNKKVAGISSQAAVSNWREDRINEVRAQREQRDKGAAEILKGKMVTVGTETRPENRVERQNREHQEGEARKRQERKDRASAVPEWDRVKDAERASDLARKRNNPKFRAAEEARKDEEMYMAMRKKTTGAKIQGVATTATAGGAAEILKGKMVTVGTETRPENRVERQYRERQEGIADLEAQKIQARATEAQQPTTKENAQSKNAEKANVQKAKAEEKIYMSEGEKRASTQAMQELQGFDVNKAVATITIKLDKGLSYELGDMKNIKIELESLA